MGCGIPDEVVSIVRETADLATNVGHSREEIRMIILLKYLSERRNERAYSCELEEVVEGIRAQRRKKPAGTR
jgi:hypothetical protein